MSYVRCVARQPQSYQVILWRQQVDSSEDSFAVEVVFIETEYDRTILKSKADQARHVLI